MLKWRGYIYAYVGESCYVCGSFGLGSNEVLSAWEHLENIADSIGVDPYTKEGHAAALARQTEIEIAKFEVLSSIICPASNNIRYIAIHGAHHKSRKSPTRIPYGKKFKFKMVINT